MALVLEQLQFSVETKQLDLAAQKIRDLGEEIGRLRKPLDDLNKPLGGSGGLAGPDSPVGQKPQREVKTLDKLLEKLTNTYLDMGRGFSKGEASILNQARNLGAMQDQLLLVENALQNIKELNKDPFDSSLGGVRSITQEFERLTQRINLASQGITLTTKQLGEYSRLAAEARSKTAGEGLKVDSPEGQARMNQLLKEAQTEYLKTATSVNQLTNEEQQRLAILREQEKAQRLANSASIERAKLQDDLILREQRLAFVNKELAAGLTTASANALFKYQKDLEALGKSTDEITKRTTAFRAGLVEKQGHSPIKQIADDASAARKQVDHLARALGPQITDIFVGLATGQSPMTILLQQGGQLRDQMALAGVESSKMGESLRTAASYMVTSVAGVAKAIGELFIGAIVDSGKAITNFGVKAVGAESIIARFAKTSPVLFGAVTAGIGAMTIGIGAFSIAGIVAFLQVEKQMKEFTRNLVLTGGSLGMTTDSAIGLAKSMNDVGISSSKALEVMQAMAKEGGFVRSEIQMITQSAVDMQKWLGISVEDTVKQFAKLKDTPVEALIEVAKKTGEVDSAVLLTVESLRLQGRTSEASALAMKEYADVTVQQVQRVKAEYTSFAKVMIEIGAGLGKFWDGIKEMWIQAAPSVQLTRDINILNAKISSPGIGSEYKKQLEDQRDELTKQLLLLDKVNLAEETKRQNQSESAKVFQQATATYEKYRGTLEKLDIDKKQEINNQEKLKQQLRDGIITQENYDYAVGASKLKVKKIDEDIAKEGKKNNSEAIAAQKKLENYYDSITAKILKVSNAGTSLQESYSKTQKAALDIFTHPDFEKNFSKLSDAEKIRFRELLERAHAEELAGNAFREEMDLFDKATTEYLSTRDKMQESLDQSMAKAKQEGAIIEYQNSLLGVSSEQREYLLAIYKEELAVKEELRKNEEAGFGADEQKIKQILAIGEARKANIKLLTDDQKRLQQYSKSFEDIFSKMGDAIADFAMTGKWNFGDLVKSMMADLVRFEMRLQMSNLYNALGGGSGIIESVTRSMGFNLAPVRDATVIPVTQAMGGAWDSGIQAFAKGGTFTNSVVSSPTLFKFAKGTGLMGEAGPEAIIPLTRGSDGSLGVRAEGSSSSVQVVINNNSNATATANETVDSKGNRRIEVMIGEATAGEINRSGSSPQRSIRSTFGLQPALIRR